MRKELRFGVNESHEFANINVRKAYIEIQVASTAVATAISGGIDLSTINVTKNLRQGGIDHVSTTHLLPLALKTAIRTGLLGNLIGAYQKGEIIQNKTASLKEIRIIRVDLTSNVNLRGTDKLEFNINMPALASCCSSDAQSTSCVLVVEDGIANQENVPVYELYNINNDRSSFQQSLGDDVTGIWFLNSEKNYEFPNAPFSSATIQSNVLNETKYITEIISDEILKLPVADRIVKGQNYCLYSGIPMDSVKLNIPLNVANVTNNKNWVLIERRQWNTEVAGRQFSREKRRVDKLKRKFRF